MAMERTFRVESPDSLPGFFIEADVPLAESADWVVPPALIQAMATGAPLRLESPVSSALAQRMGTIQNIYAEWVPGLSKIDASFPTVPREPARGVSLFFSGGVDSFYSLLQHRDEIDNLILIHGFDIPLSDEQTFRRMEVEAQAMARLCGCRLIVVRTNLRVDPMRDIPCSWVMYYGAVLAAVAHALAPQHAKVYIASGASYVQLHPDGSHPLLDPLWSSEAVQLVHDSCDLRLEKLRALAREPEMLSRIRVCWDNGAEYNCGRCEKCLRTMLALRALGVERCAAFPDTLDPRIVRRMALSPNAVHFWRQFAELDLPAELAAAVREAIWRGESGLPPRTGNLRREFQRLRMAGGRIARTLYSLR